MKNPVRGWGRAAALLLAAAAAVLFSAQTTAPPTAGIVVSSAALANLAPGQYQTVIVAPGNIPALNYGWSGTPCTAADGVSQVSPNGNTAAGCWNAVFLRIDARYWGAKGDGVTDDLPALTAALTYAHSVKGCLYIPATATGYRISSALTNASLTGDKSACITGDPPNLVQPTTPTGTVLLTTDTSCLVAAGQVRWEHLYCFGNGATSANPVQTIGFDFGSQLTTTSTDLHGTGYVVCLRALAASVYGHVSQVTCDEHNQYPNLVNSYPEYCILFIKSASGTVQAWTIDGLTCRGGSQVLSTNFTGDGATTAFDVTLLRSGWKMVLYAADDLYFLSQPTGAAAPTPLVLGPDYTLWDCGAAAAGNAGSACPSVGSGGTQIFGQQVTASLSAGSTAATLTNGLTTGWPTIGSPSQLLAWSPGLTDQPTYVAGIVDSTHFTLSQPAIGTGSALMNVVQVNVGSIAGNTACANTNPPTCGTYIEARMTTAPASGAAITAVYQQPWYAVDVEDHDGGNNVFRALGLTGGRILYKHSGPYGNDLVDAGYVEIYRYCASVDYPSRSGDAIRMGRTTGGAPPSGTNQNCPIYVAPNLAGLATSGDTGGVDFEWNGSPWRKTTLPGNSGSFQIGSNTAPLPLSIQSIRIAFTNMRCATASQLQMQGSEDGSTWLAGTSYEYHVPGLTQASASYAGYVSAGTSAYPLSGGSAISPTSGVSGSVEIFNPGASDVHPVTSTVGGRLNNGNYATSPGAGAIIGTPAPLAALRLSCGSGSGLSGTVMWRPVF